MIQPKSITIDLEGYPSFNNIRVTDALIGQQILKSLQWAPNGAIACAINHEKYLVEAFDQPLVLKNLTPSDHQEWVGHFGFQTDYHFKLQDLMVDEWDRFHGVTSKERIPFVFSRPAQSQLFESLDEFDDDRICYQQQWIDIKPLYHITSQIEQSHYWCHKYIDSNFKPGWELNEVHPGFRHLLPQLKLNRSRVLVLGCGTGNDAAFLAEQGHIVTAVDFSITALTTAQTKYSHLKNIQWIQQDILSPEFQNFLYKTKFDLILEHTCYCAISPTQRSQLVNLWKLGLEEKGYLLGIFFTMWRPHSPPYGGTEWEIRERLKTSFDFMYWHRLKGKPAIEERLGKELLIFAQKKSNT